MDIEVPRTKLRKRKWPRRLGALFCLLLVAGGLLDYFSVNLFCGTFIPITGTRHYRQVLNFIRKGDYPTDSDVLEIFPKRIPEHATNTRMSLHQLPGDMNFELRCTLPAEEVAALVARVGPIAKASGRAGDELVQAPKSKDDITNPVMFETADGSGMFSRLSSNWMIYVTDVGEFKGGNSFNVFYESGIAVDVSANDVIFWLQSHAS